MSSEKYLPTVFGKGWTEGGDHWIRKDGKQNKAHSIWEN